MSCETAGMPGSQDGDPASGCQAFDSHGEMTATPPTRVRLQGNERLRRKLKISYTLPPTALRASTAVLHGTRVARLSEGHSEMAATETGKREEACMRKAIALKQVPLQSMGRTGTDTVCRLACLTIVV